MSEATTPSGKPACSITFAREEPSMPLQAALLNQPSEKPGRTVARAVADCQWEDV